MRAVIMKAQCEVNHTSGANTNTNAPCVHAALSLYTHPSQGESKGHIWRKTAFKMSQSKWERVT